MTKQNVTRRSFVKGAAAASITVPYLFTSIQAKAQSANEKLTIGSIGVGGSRGRYSRGGSIARGARGFGQTIAVCDVDQLHNEEYKADCAKKDMDISMYTDYREMLEKEKPDVVTIGTPDHWHVPIAIAALRSGSHVYCEKPLTLTIDEGIQVCKAVKETGKTFQVGTQQRSENDRRFLDAIAMVQLGMLGDDVRADVAIGGAPLGGPFPSTEVPEGLNWDFWVGPAPFKPYSLERRKYFRWFLEYSGGKMTDWGAHHIDIAQWALSPEAAPVEVEGKGVFGENVYPEDFNAKAFFDGEQDIPDSYNAAGQFNINLKYANGAEMSVNHKYTSEDRSVDFGNGILFTGSKGRIFVNRGSLNGAPVENLTDADKAAIDAKVEEIYGGKVTSHMQNFFDCIATSGKKPVSDVFSHHRTMTSCHLCNLAILLKRPLKWDTTKEEFINDDEANSLRSRKHRALTPPN